MQTHPTAEIALAATCATLGLGKLMEALVHAQPILASISYIVAIIAGITTIYFKFKHRQ